MGGVVSSLGIPESKVEAPNKSTKHTKKYSDSECSKSQSKQEKRKHDVPDDFDESPVRKKIKCERMFRPTADSAEKFKYSNLLGNANFRKCPFLTRLMDASFAENTALSGEVHLKSIEENYANNAYFDQKMEIW